MQQVAWEERRDYRDDDLPVELYNLQRDLEQRVNLAEKYPEKVTELKALLTQIKEQGYPSR
jgi:hypothetical protein